MRHRPCGNCPWRVDAPRKYWDPSHFAAIAQHCRGDGMGLMDCHKSTPDTRTICAGWAAVEGHAALGLRIAPILGQYDPSGLDTSGLALYPSFDAMLAANGCAKKQGG